MKYRFFVFALIFASLIFISASPWEGAGAIAPSGELPASGFFVATNSFPRNTVVDIVNIETGRSARVIVASTLDSPGLLAIVSREAAESIGMRAGSVSRIRMTQPSDPIAYFRFQEGIEAGPTGFDPSFIHHEEVDSALANGVPRVNGSDVSRDINGERASTIPPFVLDPEWADDRNRIVDMPITSEGENFIHITETPESGETMREEQVRIAEETAAEEAGSVHIAVETVNEEAERILAAEETAISVIAETEAGRETPYHAETTPEVTAETVPSEVTEGETVPFTIVAAEERPPAHSVQEIDPERIIPGIGTAPVQRGQEQTVTVMPPFIVTHDPPYREPEEQLPVTIPEDKFVEHIPERIHLEEESERISLIDAEQIVRDSLIESPLQEEVIIPEIAYEVHEYEVYEIEESIIIPEIAHEAYEAEESVIIPEIAHEAYETEESISIPEIVREILDEGTAVIAREEEFSIPRIYSLDRGRYYVQLAAFDTTESIENAIANIDLRYNPVVYKDGDEFFRILLGPLNQGESAAVLQRFRSIGYDDAFVRHVR